MREDTDPVRFNPHADVSPARVFTMSDALHPPLQSLVAKAPTHATATHPLAEGTLAWDADGVRWTPLEGAAFTLDERARVWLARRTITPTRWLARLWHAPSQDVLHVTLASSTQRLVLEATWVDDRQHAVDLLPDAIRPGHRVEGPVLINVLRVMHCLGAVIDIAPQLTPMTLEGAAAHEFFDGLARVEVPGGWGYCDPTGAVVIEGPYVEARNFCEQRAAVKSDDGYWRFINLDGHGISYAFATVEDFRGGKAWVASNDRAIPRGVRWKRINRKGQVDMTILDRMMAVARTQGPDPRQWGPGVKAVLFALVCIVISMWSLLAPPF